MASEAVLAEFEPSHYVEMSFSRASHAIALCIKDPGEGFSLEEMRRLAIMFRLSCAQFPVEDALPNASRDLLLPATTEAPVELN